MTTTLCRGLSRVPARIFGLLLLLAAGPLSAADLALVLANSDYRRLQEARGASDMRDMARDLADAGFDVFAAYDADTDDMREAVRRFREETEDADRILILLDGHIVSSSTDAWLLGREARDVDLVSVPSQGISLSSLAAITGRNSVGRAVILVGRSGGLRLAGEGLRSGTQGIDLPQGVTLARGSNENIRTALFDGLLRRGISIDDALEPLSARGFLSKSVAFSADQQRVDTTAISNRALEEGYWEAARALNTVEGMQLYLNRYPNGRFAGDARDRIAAIEADRETRWQREEADLNLSRNERRTVQRDLTVLGYNTRGVDGIFGRGTRTAIAGWQRDRGYRETTFLDRRQLRQIHAEADDLRREQAEEARRADEDFWRRNGADGREEGLRAYLDRYPDGIHADEAKRRLADVEAAREDERREAREREINTAWEEAQERDTIRAYRRFLNNFPDTRYTGRARERIQELRAANAEDEPDDGNADDNRQHEAAKAQERQIVNNPVTMMLLERRLAQFGYNPGPQDGRIDGSTRRAIRALQRDRGIFVSGYVDTRTAAVLLTGR